MNTVINILLINLASLGFKSNAYADIVVPYILGVHLNMLSSRMETAFKILNDWCITTGLSMNTSNTEPVLFSKKHKIPRFNLPKLNGMEIGLADSAKYIWELY